MPAEAPTVVWPDFEALAAPIAPAHLGWKPGATTRDKSKGLAMAHITARTAQERLDDVCGPAGWRVRYEAVSGGFLAHIAVRVVYSDGAAEWVEKTDGSDQSEVQAFKGGISGAFKRCAVVWGIGRDLYRFPALWARLDDRGRFAETPQPPRWYLDAWRQASERPRVVQREGPLLDDETPPVPADATERPTSPRDSRPPSTPGEPPAQDRAAQDARAEPSRPERVHKREPIRRVNGKTAAERTIAGLEKAGLTAFGIHHALVELDQPMGDDLPDEFPPGVERRLRQSMLDPEWVTGQNADGFLAVVRSRLHAEPPEEAEAIGHAAEGKLGEVVPNATPPFLDVVRRRIAAAVEFRQGRTSAPQNEPASDSSPTPSP